MEKTHKSLSSKRVAPYMMVVAAVFFSTQAYANENVQLKGTERTVEQALNFKQQQPINNNVSAENEIALLEQQALQIDKKAVIKAPKTEEIKVNKVVVKDTTPKNKKVQNKLFTNKVKKRYLQSNSNRGGQKVLAVGKRMALHTKEVVRGSCWDYIHAVYNRAGYPMSKRVTVHKGKKSRGPYAHANKIKPGDWLYFLNHSFNGSEHSGIFVSWVNKKKRIARVLSYGGQNKKEPGRYRNYKLTNVYNIMRPKG